MTAYPAQATATTRQAQALDAPETNSMQIRYLQATDIGEFLTLMHQKATFDGCPGSMLATEQSLLSALFSPAPPTRALVVEVDGRLVGMATYHAIFSTFIMQPGLWLDDLFIAEPYRGRGLGQALMARLCSIAVEQGCARVDWTVDAANAGGKRFYTRIGAHISNGLQLCRLTAPAIAHLASERQGHQPIRPELVTTV